ncbi:hypothetical protein [Rhizobium ruizarguesonis]|jgi:hypothetical protein|uniref:hypothetical protein n=1 Tax=Rhizobium ruizarguesonis TaxID=2081791 RepID=UPI00102FB963|nr:hypothetical protein [Rhizobium ruizarguesonis]TBA57898.1 hypothetical protein ELH59_07580 [Rhizobium ruizarguesonis]
MNTQAKKNIRQAFPVITFGSREWEATQAAASWVEKQDVGGANILTSLDLLTIARRCLVDGETLEAAGEFGPYGTAAQQRAWAAGQLAAACYAILAAEALTEERRAAAARIAYLEKKVELLRAETRAAARFKDIVVPFRKPRAKSVDWDAA